MTPMRKLLIVSPHFPPTNAADMHRVRVSLSHYREFGWDPVVLAVDPDYVEAEQEPLFIETVSGDIPVHRVAAMPVRWTRMFGFGDMGVRALPYLYNEGARMIRHYGPHLAFFSTTMFATMTLGRLWKRRYGVPFVLDMQDPWINDYYERQPPSNRPPKYHLAQRVHRVLEPWTMREVAGLTAVSVQYNDALRERYPWIAEQACATIPFGAEACDTEVVDSLNGEHIAFDRKDGMVHGVYVGRLGVDMRPACQTICRALQLGLERAPDLFGRVRLHFIGTDYAQGNRAQPTIRPIAEEMGLSKYIEERPHRVPYFSALASLRNGDFIIAPGSDDPRYSASKIFSYILMRRPMMAVFHESSSTARVLRDTKAGDVVTFRTAADVESAAARLAEVWQGVLERIPFEPSTDWHAFEPYTARAMTQRQCELFDRAVAESPRPTCTSTGVGAIASGRTVAASAGGIDGRTRDASAGGEGAAALPAGNEPDCAEALRGLRILVVMPAIPIQGMERSTLQIMRMLKQQGADLLCITERDHGERVRQEVEAMGCRWSPVRCTTILHLPKGPRDLFRQLHAWWTTARGIRRVLREYRPTHIHLTNITYFMYALPIVWNARQPVVFRVPDAPEIELPTYKQMVSDWLWRRWIVPVADVLVCNCQFTVDEIRRTGARCCKTEVIYNCLSERSRPSPSDAPTVNPDRFNVAYTARITSAKGADLLVEAAIRMVREGLDVDFYLAGQCLRETAFADGVVRRVEDEGLESRIHVLGEIDDVFGLLEQCHLHVQPARMEVFPNAVIEAKSHGRASVVFPSGGLPELVTHLEDGYVCRDRTADALHEGLRYFFDHREALDAAGEAARRSVHRFSGEQATRKWTALYKRL